MITVCTIVVIAAMNGFAAPINWDIVTGSDISTTANSITINADTDGNQSQGLHGGGFMADGPKINVSFDLWTMDSYSSWFHGGEGWYDVFVININQEGYIFDNQWYDPVTADDYLGGTLTGNTMLPGATFAWGGQSWMDNSVEVFTAENLSLSLDIYDSNDPFYVSVFWKTDFDNLYASGGEIMFDAVSTPEPATVILFGIGLIGLGVFVRSRKV